MNLKAWIFQDPKQVKKYGVEAASWYVGWVDPDGKRCCKSCGTGSVGKDAAQKLRDKRHIELASETYKNHNKKSWEEFRKEYSAKVVEGAAVRSRVEMETALNHFERIIKPKKVSAIKTSTIDDFTAKRRLQKGKKKGSEIAAATVNKELRHLRAALRKAHRWGYISTIPYFDLEKEPKSLPSYVTAEYFAAIYQACEKAKMPEALPYPPSTWWRGLIVMAYMTGWRISELLALRREDLDLTKGDAITRAGDNKGGREERIGLHAVVIEHLAQLPGFDVRVFPWNHDRTTLMNEFARIQKAAGIHLPCRESHEHTRFCHVHGFHDLRRAFATMNADRMSGQALQTLMRHKSYQTTLAYTNPTRQIDDAVASLHVPEVLRAKQA